MRLNLPRMFCLILAMGTCISAWSQSAVVPSDEKLVNRYLDEATLSAPPLDCRVKPVEPFIDFAFRFQVVYIVSCPIREFAGEAGTVLVFLRITPDAGKPIVLGEPYRLPAASQAMRSRSNIDKLKEEFEFSGGFSAGEGKYRCEVLVVDKRTNRMYRTQWQAVAKPRHSERHIPVAIEKGVVEPMTVLPWKGFVDGVDSGIRVTVLLDVAPIYSFATRLRAWDRSFLLSALSSTLAQIHCESVRLVAFNLDQQKVLFSDESFQPSAISDLNQAMRSLELANVSYEVLQHPQGTSELLMDLAKQEQREPRPSDIVIFLGPHTRFIQEIPRGLVQPLLHSPSFFYLEYMPILGLYRNLRIAFGRDAAATDTVEYLTKALGGTSFKIQSPDQLATAIKKIGLKASAQPN